MAERKESFGQLIRRRRVELGLTQESVGKAIGVGQNYIAYLENNQRRPSTELIKKLAQVLSTSPDRLFFLAHTELKGIVDFDPQAGGIRRKLPPALVELKGNRELCSMHRITEEEIQMLASIRGRGEIRTMEDCLVVLMTLRNVMG